MEQEKLKRIRCYFRKFDTTASKSWMNSFASMWTASEYIHSEFYFVSSGYTVTVDSRKPVTFIKYGNPNYSDKTKWEGYELTVTEDAYSEAYTFCRAQQGKPFDKSGIFCFGCLRACTRNPDGNSWICSRLMCEALKRAGILSSTIDMYAVSPSALRELIIEQRVCPVRAMQK